MKEDAPELLPRELATRSWRPRVLALSGVTDPYQPVERQLQLTRRCLEVLAECRNPVSVITKSGLVARDADLLGELAGHGAATAAISITTLDEQLRRQLEPTPSATGVYVAYSPTEPGYLELYQADGATRVAPHDMYFYSKLSWAATAGTPYLLKYYTYQGSTSGAYQFSLFQCSQDAYEEDDTLAAAKTITVGETQSRNHCEDRYDWAKFDAVGGSSYTITTTNGQNVYLTLYDGVSPYAVASSATAEGGKLRVINWTAPASGTYYIEMDRFEFGLYTDYTLNLK